MTIDCLFSVKNDRIMDWHKVLFPFKENVSIKIHRQYLIIIIKQIKYDLACSSVIRNSSKLWKWSKRRNSSFKLTCAVDIFVFHCREELNKKSLPVNCLYIIDSHEFQTHLFQSKTLKKNSNVIIQNSRCQHFKNVRATFHKPPQTYKVYFFSSKSSNIFTSSEIHVDVAFLVSNPFLFEFSLSESNLSLIFSLIFVHHSTFLCLQKSTFKLSWFSSINVNNSVLKT